MSANPILHIKDSYYFDVPKTFWRADHESPTAMVNALGGWTVRNDSDYQEWEADKLVAAAREIVGDQKALDSAKAAWKEWQHAEELHHGRPFDQYVHDAVEELRSTAAKWADGKETSDPAQTYLAENPDPQLSWMHTMLNDDEMRSSWQTVTKELNKRETLDTYLESDRGQWSEEKVAEYNEHLSGKVFIPQPFATLRNAYETESGLGISRYMIIEVVVAIIIFLVFTWLAGKIKDGGAPKGKIWNLLESFLTFLKTEVVEQGIEPHDSPKFLPLFWTIFMFIVGCNLMGMIPWVGSPTAALAVTAVLAIIVFAVGTFCGVKKFGVAGYLKNLCPELGLPLYMAVIVVPMVWVIEFASLFIKHFILAVRLLANMAAGHLVLLGVMGLAFGVHAYSLSAPAWGGLSVLVILGTTLLSFMELFVAFLQAYVFTLLASLFVGAATHHH
ncbi:MAG TPA: ATP synthase F0 subunit A [Planctomycetaceae bacterium]|nr:ATP synthase F0 subunit A [Planctomycetaceae bacterium]